MLGKLQIVKCLMGSHHRDRRKVRQRQSRITSVCVGCGKPMRRGVGGWKLDSETQ